MREINRGNYLSYEEIKSSYGWSRMTVWRFKDEGKLKPVRFAGDKKFYYSEKELNKIKNTPIKVGASAAAGE